MRILFATLIGSYGLFIGSFLNVVIWRLPRGESVVRPRSACPGCARPISARDNIPVLSWLLLRGRCRGCQAPISVRYPLVELGTGVLFAATGWWLGPTWTLPAFLYLAAITVALAMIDIDVFRLPDAIVRPSYPVSAGLLALAAWQLDDWSRMGRALLAGALYYGYLRTVRLVHPKGMGAGDVKLVGVLGLYLGFMGWGQFALGVFAAPLLGTVLMLPALIRSRGNAKRRIPFGPYLLAGCYFGLLLGAPTWNLYLQALGL